MESRNLGERVLAANREHQLIVARILEIWGWKTPWQRRAWNTGTRSGIEEVLEASRAGTWPEAVRDLASEVRVLAGRDPAAGEATTKRSLDRVLKTPLLYGGVEWYELEALLPIVENGYLARWSAAIRAGTGVRVEAAARYLGAHLAELGYSNEYLHRWWTYRIRHEQGARDLPDILDEADAELAPRTLKDFEVIVPCIAAPGIDPAAPVDTWRNGPQMATLINDCVDGPKGVRHNGGFVLRLDALDPESAAESARHVLDRWQARVELATRSDLHLAGDVWVNRRHLPMKLTGVRRQVEVGALERERILYAPLADDQTEQRIDDALQLLQPLETGGRAAAVSGAWAALESLLVTDVDKNKVVAAERFAAIVACSYPRAELTTLAYRHIDSHNDSLADQLRDANQNVEKAEIFAGAIRSGTPLSGRDDADEAALERMREVIADPSNTLERVRTYIAYALRRLYRQRNLIVHGGLVSGRLRTATLQTVPPIVGAGVDRIVHAWYVDEISPLELAAKAHIALDLVGSAGGSQVTRLLDPR